MMSGSTTRLLLEAAFWSAAGLTLYTYAGFPVLAYVRSRVRPLSWQPAPIQPSVSIIVAVHNGATLVQQKIDHLLTLDYPPELTEVIVVSDGSTDGTNEILSQCKHHRLKTIVCGEQGGKAAALNEGIQRATGELIVFVDIRPRLETDALRMLVSNFADPQVGCAAGRLVLREDGHDAGTQAIGGLYWRYEQWIRDCEARVDSPLGVYGGFYAIRRELATLLPQGTILDDMLQPLNIVRQGYRSVLDERARVFDTWPTTTSGEFTRKVRTLAGNFQLLQLAPWLLTRQNRLRFTLVSHKLLRLLVPLLAVLMLLISCLLCSVSRTYALALACQAAFYLLALSGSSGRGIPVVRRLAGAANAFCVLNAAAVVGLYKFMFTRGPLWKIWVPSTGNTAKEFGDKTRAAAAEEALASLTRS